MNSVEKQIDQYLKKLENENDSTLRRVSDIVTDGDYAQFLAIEADRHMVNPDTTVIDRNIWLCRWLPDLDDGVAQPYLALYSDTFTEHRKHPELIPINETQLFNYAAQVASKIHGLDFSKATTRRD